MVHSEAKDELAMQKRQMFFIVGTGRCGTKMLRSMLVVHPQIRVMIETHFYPVLFDRIGTRSTSFAEFFQIVWDHISSKGERWIEVVVSSEGKSLEDFRAFVAEEKSRNVSREIAGHVRVLAEFLYGQGAYILGDKTPHYGLHPVELDKLFPHCKFINLKRNGVLAARSMVSHPGFVKAINGRQPMDQIVRSHYRGQLAGFPSDPVSIEQAAQFWEKLVVATEAQLSKLDRHRVFEVFYEDLLSQPALVLARIGQFLGVEGNMDWLSVARRIPRPLALRRMVNRLPQEEYLSVFKLLGETGKKYGYTSLDYDIYKAQEVTVSDLIRAPSQWLQEIRRDIGSRTRHVRKPKGRLPGV